MNAASEVACPFCSLLCDDLSVRTSGRQLSVAANGCARSRRGFSAAPPPQQAYIGATAASWDTAVGQAAKLLKKSRKPLIAGLGADVNGIRAALLLAEKTAAVVRHKHEQQARRNLEVLQNDGWIMTTLAEARNRADVVIFVGERVTESAPRFIEKYLNAKHTQFLGAGPERRVIYLGTPAADETALLSQNFPSQNLLTIPAGEPHRLANMLALLKSETLKGETPRPGADAALAKNDHRRLLQAAQWIAQARYAVFVWCAARLPAANADLLIRSLCDLIRRLNQQQRAAGLTLADNNAGVTLQQVAAWQTGHPGGLSWQSGLPTAEADDDADGVDARVWISSLEADAPPPLPLPTIAVSSNPALAGQVDVYLPVGVPGLDHRGNLFRADGVVNLPLKKLRDSGHASAAAVITQIVSRL